MGLSMALLTEEVGLRRSGLITNINGGLNRHSSLLGTRVERPCESFIIVAVRFLERGLGGRVV